MHLLWLYSSTFFLFVVAAATSHAQLLVNNGATITLKPQAQVIVQGDTENRSGSIQVEDNATIEFSGDVVVKAGGIFLQLNSLATVRRNLEIYFGATCWRYRPGSLVIDGTIINDGDLINDGEIVIGRP
jgi:hypothetical protein